MATTKAPESTAPVTVEATEEKFTLDAKEVSKIITVLRYRLNEQVREANRKNPIFSKSQEEARAKAAAMVRALKEFSEQNF